MTKQSGPQEPPWPPGAGNNARRAGWNAYFQGESRENCPFPPVRHDLLHGYQQGWDAAMQADPQSARRAGERLNGFVSQALKDAAKAAEQPAAKSDAADISIWFALSSNMIQCGEPFSPQAEAAYKKAREALRSLTEEIAALRAEIETLRSKPESTYVSLETLPFWPWLWADPSLDDPKEQLDATERRVRINYETARAPIPGQYALLHRMDINRLIHTLWRKRVLQSRVDAARELALTQDQDDDR